MPRRRRACEIEKITAGTVCSSWLVIAAVACAPGREQGDMALRIPVY